MPKRPRQAHVPPQAVNRKRKPRRPFLSAMEPGEAATQYEEDAPSFADEPTSMQQMPAYMGARPPVDTAPPRRNRRLDAIRGGLEGGGVRVIPGQLPTYERAFLTDELKRIAITAGGLLAVVIILWL